MTHKALSYDLGGTKLAVGTISLDGRIIDETIVPVESEKGKDFVIKQIIDIGRYFLKKHKDIKHVGIASAGPLDLTHGQLLNPTNLSSNNKTWGIVPLKEIVEKSLGKKVALENDAAAAVLAEKWVGAAQDIENVMVLTLGTGLGTGILCNGNLVRSGRMLHPEAGHLIIRANDRTAPCGCGNLGCAEAFLSGRNFAARAAKALKKPGISGKELASLARSGNPKVLKLFEEYAELLSITIHNYVRIYSPEVIFLTGSFAEASDLFLKSTRMHLKKHLASQRVGIDLLPKVKKSSLKNRSGLIGGAYVAFERSGLLKPRS